MSQSAIKTGGNAFPSRFTNDGMTLRQYYAAHAPEEIPEWFECDEPNRDFPAHPDYSKVGEGLAGREREPLQTMALELQRGEIEADGDLPPELHEFHDQLLAHRLGKDAYNRKKQMNRLTRWRLAYADAMIEAEGV